MQVPSRNIRKFLILQPENSISLKMRNFPELFFSFFELIKFHLYKKSMRLESFKSSNQSIFYHFFVNFFSCLSKRITIHQLNIIKKIEKDSKKHLVKGTKIFLIKKNIKVTIWSWIMTVTKIPQKVEEIHWLNIKQVL